MLQTKIKMDDFQDEVDRIFDELCRYHKKHLLKYFNGKEGTFSNQLWKTRIYTKLVKIVAKA